MMEKEAMATAYEIIDRVKANPLGLANIADFELRALGETDTAAIAEDHTITLYCLDVESRRAVYVQTPPELDLCIVPFYYMAQYEHATRVLTTSFEEMIALTREMHVDGSKLIFIHSVGRSGSTLAGQIFAQLDSVATRSEPDALNDLVTYQHCFPGETAELRALVEATVRLLCKVDAQAAWVIKGRSFAIELAGIFYDLFPESKSIFLYRDASSWLHSGLRAFDDGIERSPAEMEGLTAQYRAWFTPLAPLVAAVPAEEHLGIVDLMTLMWLSVMDRYVRLYEMGVEMMAIRFTSWKERPRETAVAMLDYSGLLPSELDAVYRALTQDSQAGTVLSQGAIRAHHSLEEQANTQEMDRRLRQHAFIKTADYVVPNTLDSSALEATE